MNRSYAGIVHSTTEAGARLSAFQALPSSMSITKRGLAPTANPDDASPPMFESAFSGSGATGASFGNITVDGDSGSVTVAIQDHTVAADAATLELHIRGPARPWGPGGEGPEGWAGKLPFLGLHWFVFSLGSPVEYRLRLPSGEVREGSGVVHQEKNYGGTFPTAWIWGEAVSESAGVALALAGGPAPVGPIIVPNAWLIGYRSPLVNLSFHPQDLPLITATPSACEGRFDISAASLVGGHRLQVAFTSSPQSYAALYCPTPKGFSVDSVESYSAEVTVTVWQRTLTGEKLLESHTLSNAALEFGGTFMCAK